MKVTSSDTVESMQGETVINEIEPGVSMGNQEVASPQTKPSVLDELTCVASARCSPDYCDFRLISIPSPSVSDTARKRVSQLANQRIAQNVVTSAFSDMTKCYTTDIKNTGNISTLALAMALLSDLTEILANDLPEKSEQSSSELHLPHTLKERTKTISEAFASSIRSLEKTLTDGVSAENISKMLWGEDMQGVHSPRLREDVDALSKELAKLWQAVSGMSGLVEGKMSHFGSPKR